MPVIVWGNGFCMAAGTMFTNFLNEIASHGFFIVANGPSSGNQLGGQTTYNDLIKSIDWLEKTGAAKYNLDMSKMAVSGQSCGGLEAYQASVKDSRIKLTALFNSGNLGIGNVDVTKLKSPVAYFLGGAKDIAQKNGDSDYLKLQVPALKTTIDIGHIGTYYQKYGGKMGKAAVSFFKWQQMGDTQEKAKWCGTGATEFSKLGFTTVSKNGMC
ncbi:hypothetical protein BT63DRAFT_422598, partial [Microthyrium microscopicum]